MFARVSEAVLRAGSRMLGLVSHAADCVPWMIVQSAVSLIPAVLFLSASLVLVAYSHRFGQGAVVGYVIAGWILNNGFRLLLDGVFDLLDALYRCEENRDGQ